MPPSRRATLGLLGTTAATLLAGCSALGTSSDGDTTTRPETGSGNSTSEANANGTAASTNTNGTANASANGTANTNGTAAPQSVEMRLVGPETDQVLFTESGVASVGEIRQQPSGYALPVVLTKGVRAEMSETFQTAGVVESPESFEVVVRLGDEAVNRFGITKGLASDIAGDEWDGEFLLLTQKRATAAGIRRGLVGG
jgi:hypothetical protein